MVESSPAARRRRQLGELLLKEHLVTPDQLNRALEIHRATGERLGRVLLDMGVVDQEHVERHDHAHDGIGRQVRRAAVDQVAHQLAVAAEHDQRDEREGDAEREPDL